MRDIEKVNEKVRALVLMSELGRETDEAMGQNNGGPMRYRCAWLADAVEQAAEVAQPGDVVLLSPGGTSFDEFRDFEERGRRFKELVMELPT